MKYDDLTPEQQEIWDAAEQATYDAAWDSGYEAALNEDAAGYDEGYQAGVAAGFNREQQRIHSVIQMQMRWAEEQNKGKDYIFWKNVRELLTPINFEPWSEERWQEELAKDGF